MRRDGATAVEFRDVEYAIRGRRIVDGLNFTVATREVLVLLGESGCGKTTTLKLVNRLIDPTGGEVIVAGRRTTEWEPVELRRRIGYVLQEGGLFPHLTVAENIGLLPSIEGWAAPARRDLVDKLLQLTGLTPSDFSDRFPHELSGGQRQRVGVARALATDPALLLLDEPFGALDALTRDKLQREFASLVREMGKTAVFVTHDLHEAMALGTRIALMDRGRLAFMGTPSEFRASDVPLAREYLATVDL